MPVREDSHAVSATRKLILCVGAGTPLRLAVECRDVVEAADGRVSHHFLHGVPEVLDLFTCHGIDVTAHVVCGAELVLDIAHCGIKDTECAAGVTKGAWKSN